MSFTLPNIFKTNQVASHELEARNVSLPVFENPNQLKILPYDKTSSELALRALYLYGVRVLEQSSPALSKEQAEARVVKLAGNIGSLGWNAHHAIEVGGNRLDDLWNNHAPQGDDALVTLRSIEELAAAPEQGYYADRAADALSGIKPDDTRIALK